MPRNAQTGFRARAGRFIKRAAKYGVKYAKKRYVNKRGNFKLGRLVKDVAMVKKLINVERKRIYGTYNGNVGQVNGGGGGANMFDITPNISQGNSASQRNGNSVKVTGVYIQGQFLQQVNALDRNRFSVEVWCHKTKEVPMSLASTGAEIYNESPFSNQMDLISRRNQDYFSDYVCLRKKMVYMPGDKYATNIIKNQTFNLGLKLNRHLRWNDSGTLINGQYFVIIRAQSGNASSTTASTANIAHQGISTGCSVNLSVATYYVDN